MFRILKENGRITPVDSIGCSAAVISATTEELVDWMGREVGKGDLRFPETNGPVRWSGRILPEILRPALEAMEKAA